MSHHFIKFSNVHYKYPCGTEALKDVSFTISHGEKVALIGTNGAGKSTAILLMNGLLQATSGEINIGNIPITKKTLHIIRKSVGEVFQNADDQLFMPTVEEDVAFGPKNMKLPQDEIERRVRFALQAVGATELRKKPPHQLSGGEKRSVSIATVLSMEPEILVLDEPSSNLDAHARRLLIDQIKQFHHTCIIASHDLDMLWELCSRCIILKNGKVAADGPTKEIFQNKELLENCHLEQPYLLKIEKLENQLRQWFYKTQHNENRDPHN